MRVVAGELFDDVFRDEAVVCRAEVRILLPGDESYDAAAPVADLDDKAKRELIERGELDSDGYEWHRLSRWPVRDPDRIIEWPLPDGRKARVSLAPLGDIDPAVTLVNLGVHCIPRPRYDAQLAEGRDLFDRTLS